MSARKLYVSPVLVLGKLTNESGLITDILLMQNII